MVCSLERSLRLSVSIRLITVPVSILSIVAFTHAIGSIGVVWEWGTRMLEETAYISV